MHDRDDGSLDVKIRLGFRVYLKGKGQGGKGWGGGECDCSSGEVKTGCPKFTLNVYFDSILILFQYLILIQTL
jgi:hypothetical protein